MSESPYDIYGRNTWAEIDLAQLRVNINALSDLAGTKMLVIVKANAYGHGMVECARTAEECGVHMLGTATIGEALLLRENGIKTDILLVAAYAPDEIETIIKAGLHFPVWLEEHLTLIDHITKTLGIKAHAHLKIDSGMGRIGVFPEQSLRFARYLNDHDHIIFEGVYSHFHSADDDDLTTTKDQLEIFEACIKELEDHKIRPPLVHMANSPGLLRLAESRFDMVRSGKITYGEPHEGPCDMPSAIKPILQWKAKLVSIKTFPKDHPISYGAHYKTYEGEHIGIVPVGHADGWHRVPRGVNKVLLHGERVSVMGTVCMDQCMISIPPHIDAKIGDEIVLIGKQGKETITDKEIGEEWWGTNNYEVITNIPARVPRIYLR